MLYILFCRDVDENVASSMFGLKVLEYPDSTFNYDARKKPGLISSDKLFQSMLKEIDNADVPLPNVIRDLYTGDAHDIYKISTGLKVLWLMSQGYKYTYLSEWLGENCYQRMFDLSKHVDIYLYDDSDMFIQSTVETLHGEFTDFRTNEVVEVNGESIMDYLESKGYY